MNDRKLPSHIIKDSLIFYNGVTYYFDMKVDRKVEDIDIIKRRRVLSTFRHMLITNRDVAIEYVMGKDYRKDIIRWFTSNDEYYTLLGSMIKRKCLSGLFEIFDVSITRPLDYKEEFGSEVLNYAECYSTRYGQISRGYCVPPSYMAMHIRRIYGRGNYGIVYVPPENDNLRKFTFTTDSYICEMLSALLLIINPESLLGYDTITLDPSMFHLHDQGLKFMQKHHPSLIFSSYGKVSEVLTSMTRVIGILTEYSYMHTDINPNNVLWDVENRELRLIDFSGTLGDDSFFDLGQRVTKLCTKTTRPDEYEHSETIYTRNEKSDLFSLFVSVYRILEQDEDSKKPKEKIDQLVRSAINSNIENYQFSVINLQQRHRPTLNYLLSYDETWSSMMNAYVYLSWIPSYVKNETKRRVGRYFSRWSKVFKDVHLPPQSIRNHFRMEMMTLLHDPSHGKLRNNGALRILPIYNLFRSMHLFDALYEKLSFLSIRMIAKTFVYIFLSLIKAQVKDISHFEEHPVYQVLRVFHSNPDIIYLFLSPLTVLIQFEIDRVSCNRETDWFKCLYSRVEERRYYKELSIKDNIVGFAHRYYQLLSDHVIVDPRELYEELIDPSFRSNDHEFNILVGEWI